MNVSPQRRAEIIDALRRGTVPSQGLDALAVGLERFQAALDEDLARIAAGGGVFKAIRGEYGAGKTFLTRWLAERAKAAGLAAAEVQISEADTQPHKYETIYRRLVEQLSTSTVRSGGLRTVVDSWFFVLEDDVLSAGDIDEHDTDAYRRTADLMEQRLGDISRTAPNFSAVLRAYLAAVNRGDRGDADQLLAWLGGDPGVAQRVKKLATVRGDVDNDMALTFLRALLLLLRDAGFGGLLLVLDEVETMQRMRSDTRDKGLEALRKLIDDIYQGRFPGFGLVITGTPAFFDGHQGVQRLAPLAQRLATDFGPDARFDNPRAVQIRLPGFTLDSLVDVGRRVRDLYAGGSSDSARVAAAVDDAYLAELATAVTGTLGAKVGIAPRLFVKKLVDVLDRVDLYPDFEPRRSYSLRVADSELTEVERNARAAAAMAPGASDPDDVDIDLDLDSPS